MTSVESPWQCYCGRTYMSSASLRRHRPDCRLSSAPYRDFLSLLACLGGLVPGDLIYRASCPAFKWNERGALSNDTSCELPSLLTDTGILNDIIRAVQGAGVVHLEAGSIDPDEGSPLWASYDFRMSPSLLDFIPKDLQPWKIDGEVLLDLWKKVGARLLAHAFPVEHVDPKFVQRGRAYTSLLRPLLGDFLVTHFVGSGECDRLALACITASKFADKADQEVFLSTARRLVFDSTPSALVYKIQLRQQEMDLLYGSRLISPVLLSPKNHLENALAMESLILHAQQDIEDGHVSSPWGYLQWKPLNAAQPSRIEELAASNFSFLKGKLHRLSGDFTSSQKCLQLLTGQHPPPPCLFRAKMHLAAVYGELGRWEEGRQVLQSTNHVSALQSQLVQLTKAELHLSHLLADGIKDEAGSSADGFQELFNIYAQADLGSKAQPFRRDLLRCCLGLAILAHLRSRSGNQISLTNTLGLWQTARAACRAYLVSRESFPDLICCLGSAEIQLQLAHPAADKHLERAIKIRDRLEANRLQDRFMIMNLGTRWADLLNDWIEAHGRDRVLRRWTECTV